MGLSLTPSLWGQKNYKVAIQYKIYRISSYKALPRIIPAFLIMPAPAHFYVGEI